MIKLEPTKRAERAIALIAFGKHPGWDDHIDRAGDQHPALLNLKRVLYTTGIAGNIDQGTWGKPNEPEPEWLTPFGHTLLIGTSGNGNSSTGWIVARIWPSVDGRGRTRYPMVVALHATGVDAAWALGQGLDELKKLEAACTATQSADDVNTAATAIAAGLRARLDEPPTGPSVGPVAVKLLIEQPEMDDGSRIGLQRVIYTTERELRAFLPGADAAASRAQQIRIPVSGPPGPSLACAWSLMAAQLAPGTTIGVLKPDGQDFADILVGEATAASTFCLRVSPEHLPLASEVPYSLDAAFAFRINTLAQGWQSGQGSQSAPASATARSADNSSPAGASTPPKRPIPIAIIAGAGALIAVGLFLLWILTR